MQVKTLRNRRGRAAVVTACATALLVAGTWAVTRHTAGDYPSYYTAQIPAADRDRLDIADPAEALTFARTGEELLLVRSYENGTVTGVPIPGHADPVEAFTALGYEALRALAPSATVSRPAAALGLPFDGHDRNIAMGTNYADHAAETSVESAFLFPKLVQPTAHTSELPVGEGLLDYEIELGMVPLADVHPGESPEFMGLVLTNDWSNRETLVAHIDVDDVPSGAGFTSAKSEPGFLTVGELLVIPADWQAYHRKLEMELYVDGRLRQRGTPADQIWDSTMIFKQIFEAGDRTWDHLGTPVTVTDRAGTIPARTIIQTGTPEGVVYRRPSTQDIVAGSIEHIVTFGQNADSFVDSALEVYVARAHDDRAYLQAGDEVTSRADGLGLIHTRIVPGGRPEAR